MCLCSINVSGRLEKVLISEHLMSGSISLMNGKWRRLKVNISIHFWVILRLISLFIVVTPHFSCRIPEQKSTKAELF